VSALSFEEDAAPESGPTVRERLEAMVSALRFAQAAYTAAQLAAEEAKAEVRRIETESLPDLMQEFGLKEARMSDGTLLTVSEDVDAAVTEERMAAALAWLTPRGYDGIVKTKLSVDFGRGEREAAEAAARVLSEECSLHADLKLAVHPQTLKAFVRERLAAGEQIPFDVFGIRQYSRAKLREKR
jgi:hypothetical protein